MALSAVVGAVALTIALVVGVVADRSGFFHAYLIAYTFWLGLGLGSLGVALVQFLTGGHWGLVARRIFEAGASTLPLMALLFVPLLFGLPRLYAWARPQDVAHDPILQHQALYLNVPLFLVRAVVYLAIWSALALVLRRWSQAQDVSEEGELALLRLQRFSIVAVLVLAVTLTFAAIDWLMSLDVDWYSTMYPPMVGTAFLLVALAFAIVVVAILAPRSALGDLVTPSIYNNLGSLLLAFLMLWAYMSYFQYLLMWAGNLTDEIPWYLRRVGGGWLPVALLLATFGFGVPFVCLLFRPLKRNPRTLAAIASLIMVMLVVNAFWLIEPPLEPSGPSLNWLALVSLVGIGGLWLAAFAWLLGSRPLLAAHDPRLPSALEEARGGTCPR
jgi:hypothetical protein